MFDALTRRAALQAEAAKDRKIAALASRVPPPGVTVTPTSDGITLSGKRLRRRMITDPQVRNFAR